MSEISKAIGHRIRNYRTAQGLSQERLAELAGCHPTYIGQIERGEKNATIESIEKVAAALNVSLEKLFEKLGRNSSETENIHLACYDFLSAKSKEAQKQMESQRVNLLRVDANPNPDFKRPHNLLLKRETKRK